MTKIRSMYFLMLTFVISWAGAIYLILNGGTENKYFSLISTLYLLLPALSVIVTYYSTKDEKENIWFKPVRFKKTYKYYLAGYVLPVVLVIAGAAFYYMLNPGQFDKNMTDAVNEMLATGFFSNNTVEEVRSYLLRQTIIVGVFVMPILNIFSGFGQELGFRGYLLPKLLDTNSPLTASALTSLLWGIWYAPLVILGFNYGSEYKGYPYVGIIAMILFCFFCGMFFSYLTYKTKSVIPSSIANSCINSIAPFTLIFYSGNILNPFTGPAPIGFIGGFGLIIAGLVSTYLLWKAPANNNLESKIY